MPKKELVRLMIGFRHFREKFFQGQDTTYERFASGWQGPKTLVIGCCDSRVDPTILSDSGPGDLFVVRNVANLVPPYEQGGGYHGVSSAIEFGVINLKVVYIMVLGHRQCGGIRSLVFPEETKAGGFLQQWMKLAEPAKERAIKAVGTGDATALCRQTELESIRGSIQNLHTFPFVEAAIKAGTLALLGIYFDLEKGELLELNEQTGTFTPIQF